MAATPVRRRSYRRLLTVTSAVLVTNGIACILLPGPLLSNFGVELDSMGDVVYQFWGASLLGLGLLAWIARTIDDPVARSAVAAAFGVTCSISALLAVRGQYEGANGFGWAIVALFALFAAAFGRCWLVERSAAGERTRPPLATG